MQSLQHRLGMALGDAKEGAGTDADKRGELVLAKAQLLADRLAIRRLQGGAAGGELLEECGFHGNSVSMMDLRILSSGNLSKSDNGATKV